jgi:hypothetical protein
MIDRKHPEHTLQARLINECDVRQRREIVRFAIPNGDLRTRNVALRLKAEGVIPGIPDMGFAIEDARTVWLELKAINGRLSDVQVGIHHKLRKLGHVVGVYSDLDEALLFLASAGVLR